MRTLAVRRCAQAFPFIRWRGNVFRPRRPVRPWRTGRSGRDASDPPRRGLGTGSRPGVLAHPRPRPLRVASAPAIPAREGGSSAASRRRSTRSPTGWPSGRSASPSRTGDESVTGRRWPSRTGLLDRERPPGRVSGMCTSQPSAMPALGIGRGRSLRTRPPSPARHRRSGDRDATARSYNDLRNPRCAHPKPAFSAHGPTMSHVRLRCAMGASKTASKPWLPTRRSRNSCVAG